MKYKWLNKNQNDKLIIFFNGWGMDESAVSFLDAEKYDVLMFYDYNSLETDFDFEIIKRYSQKYLVAWSMGVLISSLFDVKYDFKTAINGTLKPIDDKYGIPTRVYDLTLKNFSPSGAERFITNMGVLGFLFEKLNRTFENQKSELAALKNYKADFNFKFDRIILSSNDRVIPTKNQIAFWNIEPNLESGHYPFHLFEKWSELL